MSPARLALAAAALAVAAPTPSAQPWSDAEQRVWASFDLDGAHDHGHLPKLASGAARPLPVIQELDQEGWSGGVPGDSCGDALEIPGGMVVFDPPLLDTTVAGIELCEALESCEAGAGGVDHTVWYSYTPDRDGTLSLDTFGSNYDTVLSVWNGCGVFGFPCAFVPDELACNDDFLFGSLSAVSVDVQAGTAYRIKVSSAGFPSAAGLLDFNARFAPANQLCSAAQLISGTVYEDSMLPTQNAVVEACEAQESCEFNGVGTSNSVFYRFVAPCDGFVSANTNGSDYDTLLSIHDGCAQFQGIDIPCGLPNELACDDDDGTGLASQLLDVPVLAGQEIVIKVSDYNLDQGGGFLSFRFVFSGAAPPLASLSVPASASCVCDLVSVTGTASAGDNPLAGWELITRPAAGGAWTPLANGSDPVVDGFLANWLTSGLSEGYHLLQLTATNGCGLSASDTALVYVEQGTATAQLQEPADEALIGGTLCVTGTVAEQCAFQWTLELIPESGPTTTLVTSSANVTAGALLPGGFDTSGLPDGRYTLRLRLTDSCGEVTVDERSVTLDNTQPVAVITAPRDCVATDGTVTVRGTVADDHLAGWVLQLAGGGAEGWTTLASGSGTLTDAPLTTLDLAALPKCGYTLRLVASDATLVDCAFTRQAEDLLSLSNTLNVLPKQAP